VVDLADLVVIDIGNQMVFATADDALHSVVYFGDATGNRAYSGLDAQRTARVGVRLDGGFKDYPITDPVVVADITGKNGISGLDAQKIALKAVGIPVPEIPDIPQQLRLDAPTDGSPSRQTLDQTSGVFETPGVSKTPEVFLAEESDSRAPIAASGESRAKSGEPDAVIGDQLSVISYQLSVVSYQLSVVGDQLSVVGDQSLVIGPWLPRHEPPISYPASRDSHPASPIPPSAFRLPPSAGLLTAVICELGHGLGYGQDDDGIDEVTDAFEPELVDEVFASL
jgi:hypothetical protein